MTSENRNCDANTGLYIGTTLYTTCSPSGNPRAVAGTFEDVNNGGGSLVALPNTTDPKVICKSTTISFTGGVAGAKSTETPKYLWSISPNTYTAGSVNNKDLGLVTFTADATYTVKLEVSVQRAVKGNKFITVTDAREIAIYVGRTRTFNGGNWDLSGDLPFNEKVVFKSDYIVNSTKPGNLKVCDCTVNSGVKLTIHAGSYMIVQDMITNNAGAANFVVESDGNLKQINETISNAAAITVNRNSSMKKNDYTYWSSPVSGRNMYNFSPGTSPGRFYEYNEGDDKFYKPTETIFTPGKGYAIMAPTTFNTTSQTFSGSFIGIPNNGTSITFPLKLSSTDPLADKGYNMIGNPYPSNIDFNKLFAINSRSTPIPLLGEIHQIAYFWTNVNPNRQGSTNGSGSNYSGNAYAVYNGVGGIPAKSEAGSPTGFTPTNFIKVGQGFIVKAKRAGSITFNNTIRDVEGTSNFFSKGKSSDKDRYWLKLTSPALDVNTILIGYVPGATNDFEWDYDAPLLSVGSDSFYSILNDETLGIQGRTYPLNPQDVVKLGTKHFEVGNYTISLGDHEGIFADSQSIYLKDNQNNTITNLSEGNYTFTTNKGVTSGRFEIFYTAQKLLKTGLTLNDELVVYRNGNDFVIKSPKLIAGVEVYDMSGKLFAILKPMSKEATLEGSSFMKGVYILNIKYNDGVRSTKKISK